MATELKFYTAIYLLSFSTLLYYHTNYTFIHCVHRFIITVFAVVFNQIGGKKRLANKIYIYTYLYIFCYLSWCFLFLSMCSDYCVVSFKFCFQSSLQYFLINFLSAINSYSFYFRMLNFSFTFERQFCCIQNFWLIIFFLLPLSSVV